MKRVITVVVLIALTMNCTYTLKHYADYKEVQPMIISERVGETLDGAEREKFGLFRGVEGFETAEFNAIRNGGYEVEITTTDAILVAVNRDALAIEILRDYINRFEEISKARKEFENKWQIIFYDDLGQPITKHELSRYKGAITRVFGIGCCLGGGLIGGLVGFNIAWGKDSDMPIILGLLGGALLSAPVGVLVGNKLESGKVLTKIVEARKPRERE